MQIKSIRTVGWAWRISRLAICVVACAGITGCNDFGIFSQQVKGQLYQAIRYVVNYAHNDTDQRTLQTRFNSGLAFGSGSGSSNAVENPILSNPDMMIMAVYGSDAVYVSPQQQQLFYSDPQSFIWGVAAVAVAKNSQADVLSVLADAGITVSDADLTLLDQMRNYGNVALRTLREQNQAFVDARLNAIDNRISPWTKHAPMAWTINTSADVDAANWKNELPADHLMHPTDLLSVTKRNLIWNDDKLQTFLTDTTYTTSLIHDFAFVTMQGADVFLSKPFQDRPPGDNTPGYDPNDFKNMLTQLLTPTTVTQQNLGNVLGTTLQHTPPAVITPVSRPPS